MSAGANPHPTDIAPVRAIGLQVDHLSKSFGSLKALDDVSIEVPAGSFHALLGENGAGKSTLVKCIMGYHRPDQGQLLVDGRKVRIDNPREARAAGIGMVYQNFILVPSLTAAENLIIARGDGPAIIDWSRERAQLAAFLDRMPFRVPLDTPVSLLAAGEKQKLEILKQLYLDLRFLILDEPTSVLTPGEADEILSLVRELTTRGEITVLMITHKFREVQAFADGVTVLRRGRFAGSGQVSELSVEAMVKMMIGDTELQARSARVDHRDLPVAFEIAGVSADNSDGSPAIEAIDLKLHAGEIVGIAGVSGNGQSALVETLTGQRPLRAGRLLAQGQDFLPTRAAMARHRIFGLPEEPLKNAAVAKMSVAENIALRTFDKPPIAVLKWWLLPGPLRRQARDLIARYRVKTPSTETPVANLSGGNVQRTVLARELSGDVGVLVVANPCAGLDFASVAEIRAQIMDQRNKGAAVLLVSEDLDEILELADRVAVMSGGRITYVAELAETDRATIGNYMAGHSH
jgi:simple sugar transport system ATP-binding protein